MQSASSNFTQEASGGQLTWAKPRLFADWAADGYGAVASIDDLSDQVGDSFTIVHSLDDGLPSDVTLSTTQDAVTLTVPMVYGRGNRASAYFSPYNTSSPVSGFERDVAPVKLDWGLVTSAGQEYVRLFTGQMTNLRTRGQTAELEAHSATRLKLMKLIQPPAVDAANNAQDTGGPGMNATWPISYALYKCGLYVSPPPRSGCRLWMPMHGSLASMIPDANTLPSTPVAAGSWDLPSSGVLTYGRPTWQTGPFVMGTGDFVTAAESKRSLIYNLEFAAGSDMVSQAGNVGRLEMWIKGDVAETVSPPGGAGNVPWLAGIDLKSTGAAEVKAGVGTDRKVYVTVNDGAGHAITLKSPTTLATDGAWYFVGAAWDIANKKLWVDHNGTVTTTAAPTLVTTSLPANDAWDYGALQPSWSAHLPVAEVQLTAGAQANPDNFVWINDVTYWTAASSPVVIRPSTLELNALAEPAPREAWEFIGSFAQAELAQTRTDELDRFCYLPMAYWAETAQQTVVDNLSTSLNAQDVDIDLDPSMIRNSAQISFKDTRVDYHMNLRAVYVSNSGPPIPPGVTTIQVTFESPAVSLWPWGAFPFALYGDDILGQGIDQTSTNYVSLSPNTTGGGTYATSSDVTVQVVSWDPGGCVVRFTNGTNTTYFLANQSNVPSIAIAGNAVVSSDGSVTSSDPGNIAIRGERALAVSIPTIQRRADAQRIADNVVALLGKPREIVTVSLFGDPRRQPGDLVQLTDAVNTGLSGYWRIQSITHNRTGAEYTQECTLTKARLIMHWDQSNWDEGIWGP